ncbi:hypothetical protein LX32DRAFT_635885 [Colletotrichum zoysiae]|uniref:Uncharacterized protein n=1 Tax=Colletotrichum zoysiae TaxID=1216348 RepID=A0AAD9HRZ7_9PEZI|nr:hypothetical protein LX32DRAFT_635885 [Colletotrichum zoysiae]
MIPSVTRWLSRVAPSPLGVRGVRAPPQGASASDKVTCPVEGMPCLAVMDPPNLPKQSIRVPS